MKRLRVGQSMRAAASRGTREVGDHAGLWRLLITPAFLVSVALSGCGAAGPSTTIPAATQSAAPVRCPDIDLRTQQGESVTLTGTWLGNDHGYWQVYQQGNCVWWMGYGHQTQDTLSGTIMPDFTITGVWAEVGRDPKLLNTHGTATLMIDLTKGSDPLTVRVLNSTSLVAGGALQTTTGTRVSDMPVFPPPTPNP